MLQTKHHLLRQSQISTAATGVFLASKSLTLYNYADFHHAVTGLTQTYDQGLDDWQGAMQPGDTAIREEPHLAAAACCSVACCCLRDRCCSCSCSLASFVLCLAWACSALQHVAQQVMPCI